MASYGFGRLPVVVEFEPDRLLGIGRRADMIDAYRIAISRRAAVEHRPKQIKVKNLDGTQFVNFELEPGDAAAGRPVRAIASYLPEDCVLVSIRRRGRLLIPHGDTVLQVGDLVTTFVSDTDRQQVSQAPKDYPREPVK